jgi:hypothetical protein
MKLYDMRDLAERIVCMCIAAIPFVAWYGWALSHG